MNTICAISTAPGVGGIGIVRMSGKDSIKIAKNVFVSKKGRDLYNVRSHTLNYGYIINPLSNEKIDEVLVSIMRSPNTYTGEDVIEINCHGGMLAIKNILDACLKAGAVLAGPGEFTKRAFLNGRLDLTQAEAVIDLINSKTNLGLEKAFDQLEGHLSQKIKKFKDAVTHLIAHIEASIDYPEYDIEEVANEMLQKRIKQLIDNIDILLKDSEKGKIIRDGLSTVIVGKPNVGKSSLLNALLREKRAIVTEVPGTTRDIIEEYINVGGVPLKVIDTAGIRETEDLVEKIGVEKTHEVIDKSDLVILVLDNSEILNENDIDIIEKVKNRKCIVVINKIDLKGKLDEDRVREMLPSTEIIKISAKDEIDLDKVENTIHDMFFGGHLEIKEETLITNIRHKNLLENAQNSLKQAMIGVAANLPVDCITIDLKNALELLAKITGEVASDDIINEIFSQFCLGK